MIIRSRLLSTLVLHRYFAFAFLKAIIGIIAFCTVLVFLIDLSELLRRTSGLHHVGTSTVVLLAAIRTPPIMEQILPFAVLFGAMMTLFALSKKLELVVVRSAGVSVWQFMLPGIFVGLSIGAIATFIFNPSIDYLSQKAVEIESFIFERDSKRLTHTASAVWLRKTNRSEEIIVGASRVLNAGETMVGVVIIRQSRQGRLIQRIDADSATFNDGEWILENATITALGKNRETQQRFAIPLDLSAEEVNDGFSKASHQSFWSLPDLIEKARTADLPTHRYSLQYNTLLAQPFFFVAMIIIAATVSLRFIRNGNVTGMVLAGIVAGFVLYVIRSLAEDLGSSGVVDPILAAWLPTLTALLLGFTLLLNQEDG